MRALAGVNQSRLPQTRWHRTALDLTRSGSSRPAVDPARRVAQQDDPIVIYNHQTAPAIVFAVPRCARDPALL